MYYSILKSLDFPLRIELSEAQGADALLVVLTDLFSKYVVTKAVSDNTATTAAKFLLYDVFMIYGVPTEIITDNGRHFTASLYESLLKLTGCCHVKTTHVIPKQMANVNVTMLHLYLI